MLKLENIENNIMCWGFSRITNIITNLMGFSMPYEFNFVEKVIRFISRLDRLLLITRFNFFTNYPIRKLYYIITLHQS